MRGKFGVLLLLLMLLGYLQYHFWFGSGSSGDTLALEQQVEKQRKENDGLQQRNAALAAEVEDLKSGEAAVEERARSELGMIKPGETFYRVVGTASVTQPAAATVAPPAQTERQP